MLGGGAVGSDHLPLLAEVRLREGPVARSSLEGDSVKGERVP